MSLPEVALWAVLRKQAQGFRWRRQHPAGRYVADFFCHAAQLVVEVDGEAHERGDAPTRDVSRDAWFAEQGILVLRIPAREVLRNLEGVVIAINEMATARAPSVALRAPPPPEGEDLGRRDLKSSPSGGGGGEAVGGGL
jgi:very-short-patch-repair endonuclease